MIAKRRKPLQALLGCALLAASIVTLPGAASAQSRANPEARTGAAGSSGNAPSDTGSGENGQGSNDACAQASGMSSGNCSPSSVGSDEKSRVPPVDKGSGKNRPPENTSRQPSAPAQ